MYLSTVLKYKVLKYRPSMGEGKKTLECYRERVKQEV